MNQANSRGGKDYIASGVVKAVCARHCFVLPNAVGDLQRGERYVTLFIVFDVANPRLGTLTPITLLPRISGVAKYATSKYRTTSRASG